MVLCFYASLGSIEFEVYLLHKIHWVSVERIVICGVTCFCFLHISLELNPALVKTDLFAL